MVKTDIIGTQSSNMSTGMSILHLWWKMIMRLSSTFQHWHQGNSDVKSNPYIPTRGVKLPPRPHLPLYLRKHERWSYVLLWLFLNMAGLQYGVFTGSTCVTKNPRWRLGNWKWVVDWHWSNFNIMSRVLRHQKRDFNNFAHIFEVMEISGINV